MKKIIAIAGMLLATMAWGQTFPVNNLTVAGTSTFSGLAQFNGSAQFAVSPTGPTPAAGDSSTKLATTAFIVNRSGCKNILDFGGNNAGGGAAANNTAWTNAIAAQSSNNSVCVYFPPGLYLFNSNISYTIPNLGSTITIVGDGSGVTNLVWPTGVNGITLTTKDWTSSIHVRGLTLQSQGAGTSTGLTITQGAASISNEGNTAQSDITDVTFMGSDGYTSGGPTSGTKYWATGTAVTAVSVINYISDTWLGAFGGGTGLGNGVVLSGSSSTLASVVHNFIGCNFLFNATSLTMGTWVQGVSLTGTNIEEDNVGITANGSAGMVQLAIANSQFSTYSYDVSITGPLTNVSITNNLFYVGGSASGVFVNNAGSGDYNINGNQFFPGFSPSSPNGVYVNSSAAGTNNIVSGNVFNSLGTGVTLAASGTGWEVGGNSFAGNTANISAATSSYVLLGAANAGGNSCGSALAANSNLWIGTCLSSLTQNTTFQIAAQPMTAARLTVGTTGAVGAGQSYTATLYVNGASTGLTCQISGASSQACMDFSHFVAVPQNANYTLLVTTSAGATPVGLFWSMMLQP